MVSLVVPGTLASRLEIPANTLKRYLDLLEHASGDVIAIEVKAAETVRSEDFRGIRHLARRLGDQLIAGIVFYAGAQPLPFGDRLRALPISSLWTS